MKNYPATKPVRKKIHQVHPRKVAAIKDEVENILKVGFIYPLLLTEWVSNIVLVVKKRSTIRVFIDFRDLNKVYPKENYPNPYIDKIIEVLFSHLWMDFFGYNQIEI